MLNVSNFCNIEQYPHNLAQYRHRMAYDLIFFLFSFLSPLSSLYSFLFSLILSQISRLSIIFFFHYFFFSISLFFSLPLSHHPQFFFRGVRASTADVVVLLNAIIFGIWHTKHKKQKLERTTEMPFWFNIFLFSFLSPLSSLYSFLFSFILPQIGRAHV